MSVDPSNKAQRVRIRFARGEGAAGIGHLDLTRTWERAFSAAGVVVSRSAGRKGQTRITLAAGLPSNATSEGELLDVVLAALMPLEEFRPGVSRHLPDGICLLDATEVGLGLPSLPAAVRWAEYRVEVAADVERRDLIRRIGRLLAMEQLPWEDTRGAKVRTYDLRALVEEIRLQDGMTMFMRLRCDSTGVGRPDQVMKALGLPDDAARIHRLRLVLDSPSPAREAWRRRGRFLD